MKRFINDILEKIILLFVQDAIIILLEYEITPPTLGASNFGTFAKHFSLIIHNLMFNKKLRKQDWGVISPNTNLNTITNLLKTLDIISRLIPIYYIYSKSLFKLYSFVSYLGRLMEIITLKTTF